MNQEPCDVIALVDGSDVSIALAEYAGSLVAGTSAKLTVLLEYRLPWFSPLSPWQPDLFSDQHRLDVELDVMCELSRRLDSYAVRWRLWWVEGDPVKSVGRFVDAERGTLLVMSARSRGARRTTRLIGKLGETYGVHVVLTDG